jgi:hypothetical protein
VIPCRREDRSQALTNLFWVLLVRGVFGPTPIGDGLVRAEAEGSRSAGPVGETVSPRSSLVWMSDEPG